MEDLKKINYSLHTVYQTSLAITGVVLFSFSLGMVQPSFSGMASNTIVNSQTKVNQLQFVSTNLIANEIKIGSNLSSPKNPSLVNGNTVTFNLGINVQNGTDRIKSGDQFTVTFPHDSVDLKNFSCQWNQDRYGFNFDKFFTVSYATNNNGDDIIVIKAQNNPDFKKIQQFDISLQGHILTSTTQKKSVSATASFTLAKNSSPLQGTNKTYPFYIGSSNSNPNNDPDPVTPSVDIVGDVTGSGLKGEHNSSNPLKYSDNWLGNGHNGGLYYAHSQDAMLAFSQLALPSSSHPQSIKWYIWPKNGDSSVLNPQDSQVWVHQNNGSAKSNYSLGSPSSISPNDPNYNKYKGGLVFTTSDIPMANAAHTQQPTINLVFFANNKDIKKEIQVNTAVFFDKESSTDLSASNTLVYQESSPNGYTPYFKPRNRTITLGTNEANQFPKVDKISSKEILENFVQQKNTNPQTYYEGDFDDPQGKNYTYKVESTYDPTTVGTYNFQVTATNNSDGYHNSLTLPVTLTVKGGGNSGGGGSTPVTPVNPVNPVTPDTPSSSSSSSSVASSSSSVSTPSEPSEQPAFPDYVAKKGMAVYSLRKIGLYNKKNFSTKARKAWYSRKPRVYRPMFVVTGYARSSVGHLRYKVRDVNHLTKNRNKKGYITANWKYVRPVYYAKKHSTVTVINPRGVNAYKKVNLTNEVKHYKQGTILKVTKAVHYHLTTRYILPNGRYITANRKLVNMGRHHFPKYVRARGALNRYSDVNFSKRNHHYSKRHHRLFRVYGFDYSHANSVSNLGALRYRVAHGYISGNSRLVKVIR